MAKPIILSTWSFGKIANAAGWEVLRAGGDSLDAVEQGCRAVEADPSVNTVGFGSVPDASGRLSLDGSIMQSAGRCGSVCFSRKHVHVVSLARLVMEKTDHVLLAGEGADDFGIEQGMVPAELMNDEGRRLYEEWKAGGEGKEVKKGKANIEEETGGGEVDGEDLPHNQDHDTVGVLALDEKGVLSGACSTSGLRFKLPGRVGDSPIIGHGLYVDPEHGACVCTGNGELVMGVCGSFLAVELMRGGVSADDAAVRVLERIRDAYEMKDDYQVGIITLRADGEWASAALREGYTTYRTSNEGTEREQPGKILLK